MQKMILILFMALSTNAFATQLKAYTFDNPRGGIMSPGHIVKQVRIGSVEDNSDDLTLTVNCNGDKNEMLIEKTDTNNKTTTIAQGTYKASKDCLSTGSLIWDTAGRLSGSVRVYVNPDTSKIFSADILKTEAEMRFE